MPRAHCTEDDLIALYDGELPPLLALRARWHLRLCWRCQAQYRGVEDTVRSTAEILARAEFPSEERVRAARERLLGWLPAERAAAPGRRRVSIGLAYAASVALILLLPRAAREDLPPQPASHPPERGVEVRRPEPSLAREEVGRRSSAPVPPPDAPLSGEPQAATTVAEAPRRRPSGEIQWSAGMDRQQPAVERVLRVRTSGRAPMPSPVPLAGLELQVHYVLHRLGACLGEPVEVVNDGRRVSVRGLEQDGARLERIAAALTEIEDPRLAVRLAVPPALGSKARYTRRFVPQSPRERRPPARTWLAAGLALSGEALVERENAILDGSLALMDEAWALRRLAQRFPPEALRSLDPRSRWLFERMLTDHLDGYERRAAALASLLPSGAARGHAEPCAVQWTQCVATLFAATEALHGRLFAGISGGSRVWRASGGPAGWQPEETLAALAALPAAADGLRLAWTRGASPAARQP